MGYRPNLTHVQSLDELQVKLQEELLKIAQILDRLDPTAADSIKEALDLGQEALAEAAHALESADGEIVAFYDNDPPTSGMKFGDYWIDLDAIPFTPENAVWRYQDVSGQSSGELAWRRAPDSAIGKLYFASYEAQKTADGKIKTFYADEPPSDGDEGDFWVDTNDGNHLYRFTEGQWISVRDEKIQDALDLAANAKSTADGKITTWHQDSAPDPTQASEGDIWFDTNNGNKIHVLVNGQWTNYADHDIAEALLAAADAQATADGKVETFFGESEPTASGIGDLWYKPSIRTLHRWSGSAWEVYSPQNVADNADNTKANLGGRGVNLMPYRYCIFSEASGLPPLSGNNVTYKQETFNSTRNIGPRFGSHFLDVKPTDYESSANTFLRLGASSSDYNVPVEPGKTYLLSVFLNAHGAGDRTDNASLRVFREDTGAQLVRKNLSVQGVNDTWPRYWLKVGPIPEGVYRVRPNIYFEPGKWSSGGLLVDGFQFEELPGDKEEPSAFSMPVPTEADFDATALRNGQLILQALDDAANAQASADGKIESFYQPEAPTNASEGDFWIDTDDDNHIYVYVNGEWADAQDKKIPVAINMAAGAQSTADGKVTTFFGDTEPTAEGEGDLWYRESQRTIYRWDGTDWVFFSPYGVEHGAQRTEGSNSSELNDDAGWSLSADWTNIVNIPSLAEGWLLDVQKKLPEVSDDRQVLQRDVGGAAYWSDKYGPEVNVGIHKPLTSAMTIPGSTNVVDVGTAVFIENPGREVAVTAIAGTTIFIGGSSVTTPTILRVRVGISFDGGQTWEDSLWTYGYMEAATHDGSPTGIATLQRNGIPTGPIMIRMQASHDSNTGVSVSIHAGSTFIMFGVGPRSDFSSATADLTASLPSSRTGSCSSTYPSTSCTAQASITCTPNGGNLAQGYSYSWAKSGTANFVGGTSGKTATLSKSQTTASPAATSVTTATCTVTTPADGAQVVTNPCTVTLSFLREYAPLSVTASGTTGSCHASTACTARASASASVSGGTEASTSYSWTKRSGTGNFIGGTTSAQVQMEATGAVGCPFSGAGATIRCTVSQSGNTAYDETSVGFRFYDSDVNCIIP